MTPGALPQAGGECCAFGAKHIPRSSGFPAAEAACVRSSAPQAPNRFLSREVSKQPKPSNRQRGYEVRPERHSVRAAIQLRLNRRAEDCPPYLNPDD